LHIFHGEGKTKLPDGKPLSGVMESDGTRFDCKPVFNCVPSTIWPASSDEMTNWYPWRVILHPAPNKAHRPKSIKIFFIGNLVVLQDFRVWMKNEADARSGVNRIKKYGVEYCSVQRSCSPNAEVLPRLPEHRTAYDSNCQRIRRIVRLRTFFEFQKSHHHLLHLLFISFAPARDTLFHLARCDVNHVQA
jgi:hypothetical protein